MSASSAIEWTDSSWNPTRGCTRVSEGCRNCYAEVMAARFSEHGMWGHGFATMKGGDHRWTGKVALIETQLALPLRWKKPRKVFVNSTSDLFHESLPDEAIDRVFAVMALSSHHTFQVLTKRPERMRAYLNDEEAASRIGDAAVVAFHKAGYDPPAVFEGDGEDALVGLLNWPLPNVWLGTSIEDHDAFIERTAHLRETPGAIRFLSIEPLLSDLGTIDLNGIHWVIVGGESGSKARPFNVAWARSIVSQCRKAGVACFVKQLGGFVIDRNDAGFDGCDPTGWPEHIESEDRIDFEPFGYVDEAQGSPARIRLRDKKGGDWSEWPETLRVREFPHAAAP